MFNEEQTRFAGFVYFFFSLSLILSISLLLCLVVIIFFLRLFVKLNLNLVEFLFSFEVWLCSPLPNIGVSWCPFLSFLWQWWCLLASVVDTHRVCVFQLAITFTHKKCAHIVSSGCRTPTEFVIVIIRIRIEYAYMCCWHHGNKISVFASNDEQVDKHSKFAGRNFYFLSFPGEQTTTTTTTNLTMYFANVVAFLQHANIPVVFSSLF